MLRAATALIILYTCFDTPALLANDARRTLFDIVRARPGVRVGELARALRVDYKTALYHARKLARAGVIEMEVTGRARECYARGAPRPPRVPRVVAALHAIQRGAGTPTLLGRALGVSRGTAGHLLERLAKAGLVARDGARHVLTEQARAAIAGAGDAT